MKRTAKKKLTLSKETIASLEVDRLVEVAGGISQQGPAFSDRWAESTCM